MADERVQRPLHRLARQCRELDDRLSGKGGRTRRPPHQHQAACAVASAFHTVSGVAGMSICVTPSPDSASMMRVDHRRRTADRARLAGALDAERIGLAGHLQQIDLDVRQIVGARQCVVHEDCRTAAGRACRSWCAPAAPGRGPVRRRHAPGRARSSGSPSCRSRRTRGSADDDHAGLGIHLHLGHVAAIREGVLGDIGHFGGIERGRRLAGRRLLPLRGGERDDVDAAVGADDGEPLPSREGDDRAGAASSTSAAACLPLSITVSRWSAGSPGLRNRGCASHRCRRRSEWCPCRPGGRGSSRRRCRAAAT